MKVSSNFPIVKDCQFCDNIAKYDIPLYDGRWGYVCVHCAFTMGLNGWDMIGYIINDL